MSFVIDVYTIDPTLPDGLSDEEIDRFLVLSGESNIYSMPLAAVSSFDNFCYTPALKLNLPLISEIDNKGFFSCESKVIQELSREANLIRFYWISEGVSLNERYDFFERFDYLMDGIRLALDNKAYLTIG